jgi:hypothetical protein
MILNLDISDLCNETNNDTKKELELKKQLEQDLELKKRFYRLYQEQLQLIINEKK